MTDQQQQPRPSSPIQRERDANGGWTLAELKAETERRARQASER